MDITVFTRTYEVEDRSWLGSAEGTDNTQSITLDVTKFVQATHYPKGYIRSGTVLGLITATGLYGPYDDTAADGRQTAVGFLFNTVEVLRYGATTPAAKVGAPLLWEGVIRSNRLPTASGLDAAAQVDLAAKFLIWNH